MAKSKSPKRRLLEQPSGAFHNPFIGLAKHGDDTSIGSQAPAAIPPHVKVKQEHVPTSLVSLASCGKIVIRKEKKGRGGKTVTTIAGMTHLSHAQLEMLVEKMRKAMGCGGHVEDGNVVVLQGPLGERAEQFLRGLGAVQIVIGS